MWQIVNRTPFTADFSWVRDGDGNKIWLVVAKATFDVLQDGSCRLAAQMVPVCQMAEPYGEFGATSLRYDADLAGIKPATDVMVIGDAIAPGGRAVTALDVSLHVATISKCLRVTGDRVWVQGVTAGVEMTAPQPFVRMPIVYERAFGGWDRSARDPRDHRLYDLNPVGRGFSLHPESLVGTLAPNVEYQDSRITTWRDRPIPAGFNAIDYAWSPRRELAGTYDEAWLLERAPMWPLDFRPHYHNSAPADQQINGYLSGGERVDIFNMSDSGHLSFWLPNVRLAFRTRIGRERIDSQGQLCTVTVAPNLPRVSMAWQTSVVRNRDEDALDDTVIFEDFSFLEHAGASAS